MRVFSAIPVPDEITELLERLIAIRPNPHVTLNFLGELNASEIENAREVFKSQTFRLIEVELSSIQKFRDQIHLVIAKTAGLMMLQEQLEQAFRTNGFDLAPRAYYPHIKLANLNGQLIPPVKFKPTKFAAERVVLYESILHEHYAEHVALVERILT